MIKNIFQSISESTRSLIKNRGALAIFVGLYALLLGALYGFIATREATIAQVLLTLLFAAASPLIFFMLQAAIINHALTGRIEWGRELRDSTKLALAALPVIVLGVGIMWALNRWQAHFPTPYFNPHAVPAVTTVGPEISTPSQVVPTPPFHWPTVLFATLRALIFVVLLPLALVHLWIAVAGQDLFAMFRGGARAVFARLGQLLSGAFSPAALVTYSLGLLVFGLAPYLFLFKRITFNGAWSEITVFSVRLLLVFAFSLVGWVITLSALAKNSGREPGATPALLEPDKDPKPAASAVEPEMSTV
jgi:hypothetical protein